MAAQRPEKVAWASRLPQVWVVWERSPCAIARRAGSHKHTPAV